MAYEERVREQWGADLERAERKRRSLEASWDAPDFPQHIREHWVAFPEYYGNRRRSAGEGSMEASPR